MLRSKVAVFVELAKKTELLHRQAKLLSESERAALELAETRAELELLDKRSGPFVMFLAEHIR